MQLMEMNSQLNVERRVTFNAEFSDEELDKGMGEMNAESRISSLLVPNSKFFECCPCECIGTDQPLFCERWTTHTPNRTITPSPGIRDPDLK